MQTNLFAFRENTLRRETAHTVSHVKPFVHSGMEILDVGCGEGFVAEALVSAENLSIQSVDIFDARKVKPCPFKLFDGVHLPFEDNAFDVTLLSFVLHHVPNDAKPALLKECVRVSRRHLVILEDTPRNSFDWFMARRHAETFRRKIHSEASFGFLTQTEWIWLLRGLGLENVSSRTTGRFSRSPLQPFARSVFVAQKASARAIRSC